jgi:HK97 family phage prohead protease
MEIHTKAVSAAVAVTDSGGFRGYAARFLNIDRQGDIILPGAFAKALPEFMADGGLVLADHENKSGAVIGTLTDASEDTSGLLVDVQFSATKAGQEVRRLMAEKALRKMSISFYAKPAKFNEKQVLSAWGNYGYQPNERQRQMAKSGARVIGDVSEIVEVSVVPIPANPEANILAVKSFDGDQKTPALTVAPRIDLVALARRTNLADKFWPLNAVRKG